VKLRPADRFEGTRFRVGLRVGGVDLTDVAEVYDGVRPESFRQNDRVVVGAESRFPPRTDKDSSGEGKLRRRVVYDGVLAEIAKGVSKQLRVQSCRGDTDPVLGIRVGRICLGAVRIELRGDAAIRLLVGAGRSASTDNDDNPRSRVAVYSRKRRW
jgi:hypothetical protein